MGSGFAQGGGTVTTSFLTIGLFARPHRLRGRAFTLPFWRWWKTLAEGGAAGAHSAHNAGGGGPWPPPPALVLRVWGPQGPRPAKRRRPRAALPVGRYAAAPLGAGVYAAAGAIRSSAVFRPHKHRARSFRRRYRLQRNRPLGGTYPTPSMGETSVYTLRKWETGQIT